MKQCSKCGELKEDSDFSNGRNQCKECRNKYSRQYNLDYNQERKQYSKQYYLDHKKERKQYLLTHKEQKKQHNRKYYLNHKKERKQYLLDNKEEIQQYYKKRNKKYYLNHKEQINQHVKQYALNHMEEIKKYKKQYYQSEVGKITRKKGTTKRRKMKYIPLINNPFPEDIVVEDHHILNNFHAIDSEGSWNKWFVIPIPKTTHNFVGGSANNLAHWTHNEAWIQKLYDINIKELLGIEKN